MSRETVDCPVDDSRLNPLQERQQQIYCKSLSRFAAYLRTEGKDPKKEVGYAEQSIHPRLSRFHQAVEWIWENDGPTTEIAPSHGEMVLEALNKDTLLTVEGDPYAEGSKRKFADVLDNWFAFKGERWEPSVSFADEIATDHADPFSRQELRDLWQAALTYKSIPSYNNLSPRERDRWRSHIAQELGKPKTRVSPTDWEAINHDWKIPSLIRTTRTAGWRPAMVERIQVDWYDSATESIYIPKGKAVKNDARWEQKLSSEGAMAIENWLDQRANDEYYDGRSELWLNREGNPYQSASLNRLLRNLMEQAEIKPRGRKLVWYSFRHSIGTYVYDEYRDLSIVAETLRQKSTASAERYVHPTNELKAEVAEIL